MCVLVSVYVCASECVYVCVSVYVCASECVDAWCSGWVDY